MKVSPNTAARRSEPPAPGSSPDGPRPATRPDSADGFDRTLRQDFEKLLRAAPEGSERERLQRFVDLLGKIERVPGESVEHLREMANQFQVLPPPNVAKVLGEGFDEKELLRALSPHHRHGELRAENFIVATPKQKAEGSCASVTALGLLTEKKRGDPLGFVVRTFHVDARGSRSDYLDYLVLDLDAQSARGLGDAIAKATEALHQRVGLAETTLKTAWLGRVRWALDGYDFADPKERAEVFTKFDAFREHFQIRDEELVFDRGDGTIEPFSPGRLLHAWDFAHLKSTERRLTLPVMLGAENVQESTLDVGRAFLLGDWSDPALGHLFQRNWLGARSRDPQSASSEQFERYKRIRQAREERR